MGPPFFPIISIYLWRYFHSYRAVSTDGIVIAGTKIDLLVEQIASHCTEALITKALISLCGGSTGTRTVISVSVYLGFAVSPYNFLCFPFNSLSHPSFFLSFSPRPLCLSDSFRWCVSAVTGNYSGGQEPQWCRDVSPLIHLQRDLSVCVYERQKECVHVCLCIVWMSLSPFAKAI